MNVELNPVQMNITEVRYALEHDEEFFIQFFLGDELTLPVPSFHIDVFHLMTSTAVRLCVFALPRDHAKTTLAKLACVRYWLFSDFQFIIYLSNVSATAISACQDVIGFITSENFRAVYGEVEFSIRQEGKGFYRFTLNMPTASGGTVPITRTRHRNAISTIISNKVIGSIPIPPFVSQAIQ